MNLERPTILRKRLIPYETVNLASDELLYLDDSLLITKWNTLHPKKEFKSGVSYYFLDKSFKVSRFYGHDSSLLYWYCDIIEVSFDAATNTYLMLDLLLDIKVFADNHIEILDEDELTEAYEKKLITKEQFLFSHSCMESLITAVQKGLFPPTICMDPTYW